MIMKTECEREIKYHREGILADIRSFSSLNHLLRRSSSFYSETSGISRLVDMYIMWRTNAYFKM